MSLVLGLFLFFLATISYPNPLGDLIGLNIPAQIISILLVILGILILFIPIYRGRGNITESSRSAFSGDTTYYDSFSIRGLHILRRFLSAILLIGVGASPYLISVSDYFNYVQIGSLGATVIFLVLGIAYVLDIFGRKALPSTRGPLGGLWRR